jgi:hypothetical protein
MRIRFDEGSVAFGSDFQTPTQIITVTTLAELAPAFARLEAAQRSGHWLAGYASYELGYLFEPRLRARCRPAGACRCYNLECMARGSKRPVWKSIRLVRHP